MEMLVKCWLQTKWNNEQQARASWKATRRNVSYKKKLDKWQVRAPHKKRSTKHKHTDTDRDTATWAEDQSEIPSEYAMNAVPSPPSFVCERGTIVSTFHCAERTLKTKPNELSRARTIARSFTLHNVCLPLQLLLLLFFFFYWLERKQRKLHQIWPTQQ